MPSVKSYFKRIREICNTYGILLILDEVMCRIGQTGYMFASEHKDVQPDIVTAEKGLSAGYKTIGVMLCSVAIYNTIADGGGFFQHGQHTTGMP